MKSAKNILKIFGVIFLIIIPIVLISCNMFFDLFGYILIVEEQEKEIVNEIIEGEGIDIFQSKIIIVNTEPEDDKVKIITTDFMIRDIILNSESKLVKYVEEEGIDIYNTILKINYIYIIIIAVVIFFRKLLENADMFGKFEERDN